MRRKKNLPMPLSTNRPQARIYASPAAANYRMLSDKQRQFCIEMVDPDCQNAGQAVKKVYGRPQHKARILAKQLLRREVIRATIRKLREEQASMANLTPQSITTRVDQLAREAMQDGDRALALRALQVLGKWMGLEKNEVSLAEVAGAAAAGAAAGADLGEALKAAMRSSGSVIDV